MVTGDNLVTAKAIALETGIITIVDPESACMEGPDFSNAIGGGYSDERREIFKTTASNLKVMARFCPEDKAALVKGLWKQYCDDEKDEYANYEIE